MIALSNYGEGHKDAWEKAGILHCDISAGNIMINVDTTPDKPLGILVDWDMCKYKEDLLLDARTPRATGVSVSTCSLWSGAYVTD